MPETKEEVINTTPILALIAKAGSLDMLELLYSCVCLGAVGGLPGNSSGRRGGFCYPRVRTGELAAQAKAELGCAAAQCHRHSLRNKFPDERGL